MEELKSRVTKVAETLKSLSHMARLIFDNIMI